MTWTAVRFVHLISAAIWVGGQITLFVVAAAARDAAGTPDGLLREVGRRYGAVAGPALLLLLLTGLAQAHHLGVTIGDPLATGVSRLVSAKVALWVAAFGLSGVHAALATRISRAASGPAEDVGRLRRLSRGVSVANLIVGVAAVWVAADLAT